MKTNYKVAIALVAGAAIGGTSSKSRSRLFSGLGCGRSSPPATGTNASSEAAYRAASSCD
jgi:hypothetical protein